LLLDLLYGVRHTNGMTRKHSLDSAAFGAMVLLCAMWGFQQVAIKSAIPEIAPIWQSGIRSLGATILVGMWMVVARIEWTRGLTLPGMVAGALFATEFGLLYFALRHTDAARAVLLLYTSPFVVAVGAHFLIKGDKLSPAGWAGVAMAFAGTATVMQASFDMDGTRLLGDLCALSGGIAWGLTMLVVRTTGLSNAAPAQTLLYQLIVSGLSLCAVAWVFEGTLTLPQTRLAWSSMVYQTLGVATLSLLGWFALVARYSATKLSVFTFMTPLFGALAGILFLNEYVTPHQVIALALIIIGIVIVNLYGHAKEKGALIHENA
jgi:drug/metabolite transporter (DMT)-like permease